MTPRTPVHERPSSLAEQPACLDEAGPVTAVVWTGRDLAVTRADRPA